VAIGALGAGWTAACLWIVIPAASGGHVSPFYGHFEGVGGSPSGVLRTAFTEPGALVDALTSWRDVGYVAAISAPLLGLFLASPVLALGAAPQLTINLLSGWPATTSANQHYTSAILPYLVAATILGIGRMSTSRGRLVASGAVLEVSVLLTIAFAPWPGLALDDRATLDRNERREALSRAVDLVPGDAAVAATNAVGAHLSERRYIYSVPALGRAEWVVIDRKDTYLPQYDDGRIKRFPERLAQFERRLRLSGNWRRIYTRDDVVVYRLMRPEAAA
jgi:uncharacterized membrane protein